MILEGKGRRKGKRKRGGSWRERRSPSSFSPFLSLSLASKSLPSPPLPSLHPPPWPSSPFPSSPSLPLSPLQARLRRCRWSAGRRHGPWRGRRSPRGPLGRDCGAPCRDALRKLRCVPRRLRQQEAERRRGGRASGCFLCGLSCSEALQFPEPPRAHIHTQTQKARRTHTHTHTHTSHT